MTRKQQKLANTTIILSASVAIITVLTLNIML